MSNSDANIFNSSILKITITATFRATGHLIELQQDILLIQTVVIKTCHINYSSDLSQHSCIVLALYLKKIIKVIYDKKK